MSAQLKRQTGPLSPPAPHFETDAQQNKRDALLMLDNLEELQYPEVSMLRELMFNFGYTEAEAGRVYREWLKVQ